MRNARILAATLLLVLLVLPCAAAQAVAPLTPAEEAAVLRLVRGTPPFARDWADGIVPMQIAAGTLRRSALLAGCAPLSRRALPALMSTGPGPIGAFDEALDTLYPLSAAARDDLAVSRGMEGIARAEVLRICPPPVRPAPSH